MRNVVGLAALAFIAGACSPRRPVADTTTTVADSVPQGIAVASTDGCVRGEPEPLLGARGPGQTPRFQRTGTLSATEDLSVNDTTTLRITHGGCAHYVESYAFTVRGATSDTTDSDNWLRYGAALLRSLPVVEGRAQQIEALATTLFNQASNVEPYKYGEPISVPELTTITVTVTRNATSTVIDIVYDVAL